MSTFQSFLAVIAKRCTHRSDGVESLAFPRALSAADMYGFFQTFVHAVDAPVGSRRRFRSCFCSFGSPAELFTLNPHTMEDDGEFSGNGHHRFAAAFGFHQIHAPGFE